MSDNKKHSSGIIDKAKQKFQNDENNQKEHGPNPDRQGDAKGDIHEEHNFVKPQPFQSKEAKKDNQTFLFRVLINQQNIPIAQTFSPIYFIE